MLATLATIFTPVNTVRGLAGAAAVATAAGAVVQSDVFQAQTGQILASAIQTARQNQANQMEMNLRNKQYSVYRVRRDVIEYHNMCSLETALSQVQASLRTTAPDGGLTPPAKQGEQTTGGPPPSVIATTRPTGVSPFRPQQPPQLVINDPIGPTERLITPDVGRRIEAALCLKPDMGTVTFGPNVRTAIDLWRDTPEGADLSKDVLSRSDGLTDREAAFLQGQKCDMSCYRNPYERYGYSSPEQLEELRKLLSAELKRDVVPSSRICYPSTRGFYWRRTAEPHSAASKD